ncbi:uncharacterized protein B0I36DRAFT_435299 [Microdochium trichocladiopsis]|uniref:Uncharacterized protein n=1 Tax=Microdochium trichocladiopsis TaxID=1682393 RepID=A0A9P8XYS9_9PEZI|nr:uncharacterized protein B0I36DRAFT_435299 [Microdochium trichocladiopsis]KAH7021510.1 hypothetical protein B0I36DRAFT_435299 [Microdochium trichocladiopsis]
MTSAGVVIGKCREAPAYVVVMLVPWRSIRLEASGSVAEASLHVLDALDVGNVQPIIESMIPTVVGCCFALTARLQLHASSSCCHCQNQRVEPRSRARSATPTTVDPRLPLGGLQRTWDPGLFPCMYFPVLDHVAVAASPAESITPRKLGQGREQQQQQRHDDHGRRRPPPPPQQQRQPVRGMQDSMGLDPGAALVVSPAEARSECNALCHFPERGIESLGKAVG